MTESRDRTDENCEKEAMESFDKVAKKYKEYLKNYFPIEEGDSVEPLLWIQAEIIGHLVYIARPLGYHRRKEKEFYAEYVEKMRKRRAELLPRESSATAATAKAKAEFAHIDAKSKRHGAVSDELDTLQQIGDSIRFAISQHIKVLTNERLMVASDKVHP